MGRKKNTTQSQRNAGILGKIVNVLTDPRSVRKLNVLTRGPNCDVKKVLGREIVGTCKLSSKANAKKGGEDGDETGPSIDALSVDHVPVARPWSDVDP